jgi:hypothetical protein
MNAKDKVEVLRQQVNALLSIERELIQERQEQLQDQVIDDRTLRVGKPPMPSAGHSSTSDDSRPRKTGT